MIIKDKNDWVELARVTLPLVPEYASSNGVKWDALKAEHSLGVGKYGTLYRMLETLWQDLPDHAGIRRRPFFDICDLCSECWVLEQ